jgi:hypothetical protein
MRKFQKKLTENTEKKETEDKTENKTKGNISSSPSKEG